MILGILNYKIIVKINLQIMSFRIKLFYNYSVDLFFKYVFLPNNIMFLLY
jgi:hypothetical protein